MAPLTRPALATVGVGIGVGVVIALAGCASSASSTAATKATAAPAPHDTSAAYTTARAQWKAGADKSSADQPLAWLAAAKDLAATASAPGYTEAIYDLEQLTLLPDPDQSAAQHAQFQQFIVALDTFFDTPKLYR